MTVGQFFECLRQPSMWVDAAIHATVGTIPIVGDVFDAFFRVNQRNMRILRG